MGTSARVLCLQAGGAALAEVLAAAGDDKFGDVVACVGYHQKR